MYYKAGCKSPVGGLTLAASEKGLIGLWIEGQKYEYKSLPEENIIEKQDFHILAQARAWLDDYFNGLRPPISRLPLDPPGTPFQKSVWEILVKIPYGSTVTYGDIAMKIAAGRGLDRMSAQAVGGAVGHNQISIIIPCHRVVGSNGSLTGYAGGIDKKIMLLKHEGADMEKLFVPTKGTAL